MVKIQTWSRGFKVCVFLLLFFFIYLFLLLFFILNSAKYEICPANKSQITDMCKFCLAKHSWAMLKISLLKYEKCQPLLAFSYLLAEKIFMLRRVEHEKSFITLGPDCTSNVNRTDLDQRVRQHNLIRFFVMYSTVANASANGQ